MHDLDRSMFEASGDEREEVALEEEEEFRELLGELSRSGDAGEAFDDRSTREVALASELLEAQTPAEIEKFLGALLRRVADGGRRFARSATGRSLLGVLKQAAQHVVDTPPAEVGLELEGLSQEDSEFEVARAFVRFAEKAARLAEAAPPTARPADIASAAAAKAAGQLLPGLLATPSGGGGEQRRRKGGGAMTTYETHDSEYLEVAQEWEADEFEDREDETELVNELLEVTNEEELEQFLGGLLKKVAKGVGGVIRSPVGRALTEGLKKVAGRALPALGGTLGNLVVPGLGGVLGAQAGSMAAKMFELELEGMDEQEAEFEVARQFVRLAGAAGRNAARAPSSAPPRAVAQAALVTAARRHAPGLVRGPARRGRPSPQRRSRRRSGPPVAWGYDEPDEGCTCGADAPDAGLAEPPEGDTGELGGPSRQSGRWVRRGRKIVIMGI